MTGWRLRGRRSGKESRKKKILVLETQGCMMWPIYSMCVPCYKSLSNLVIVIILVAVGVSYFLNW